MLDWNNIDTSPHFTVNTITGRRLYGRTVRTLQVPGQVGAHLEGVDYPPRYIQHKITVKAANSEELANKIEEINRILITDEPVPFKYSDEPGKTYYGITEGIQDDVDLDRILQTTFTVVCVDPYKYGPVESKPLPNDTVNIWGSANASPMYRLNVLAPITYIMISNQRNEHILLGEPIDLDAGTQPFEKYQSILRANGVSLVGWTQHNYVDGGVVAGTMGSDGRKYYASSYGSGTGWHGPAMKTSLPESIQDFRLDAMITFQNEDIRTVGRVEIYLLDSNGLVVGKVAMKNTSTARNYGFGEARAGDDTNNEFLIASHGVHENTWTNFNGLLRIEREGNEWRAYFAKVREDGTHHARRTVGPFIDVDGLYSRGVTQIAIHVGQVGTYRTPNMGINSVEVFKIVSEPEGVPYIALPGDTVEVDVERELVLVNGEERDDLVNFATDWFELYKGRNEIYIEPEANLTGAITYRERSL